MIASSLARQPHPQARTTRDRGGTAARARRPRHAPGSRCASPCVAFAGVLVVAGVVRVTLAGRARGWLGYSFPGVSPRPNVAVAIFAHNGRAILGVFGLLLIAQLARAPPGRPGRAQRLILAGGELILAGVIAANVLVVGAGLGAYGERMVRAMLPHGPVELAAYALALALYLQGRRRALPAAHLAKVVGGERRAARARRRARDLRERMRPLRVLLVLLLIGGGLAASLVFVSKAARSLHGSPLFQHLAVDDDGAARTTGTPAVRARERRRLTPRSVRRRPAPRHRARQRSRAEAPLPPGTGIPAAGCCT